MLGAVKIIGRTLGGAAVGALLGFTLNRIYLWVLAKNTQDCARTPYGLCNDNYDSLGNAALGVLIGVVATAVICLIGCILFKLRPLMLSVPATAVVALPAAIWCASRISNVRVSVVVFAGVFAFIALLCAMGTEMWQRTR